MHACVDLFCGEALLVNLLSIASLVHLSSASSAFVPNCQRGKTPGKDARFDTRRKTTRIPLKLFLVMNAFWSQVIRDVRRKIPRTSETVVALILHEKKNVLRGNKQTKKRKKAIRASGVKKRNHLPAPKVICNHSNRL